MKKKFIEEHLWVKKFWSSDFYGLIFSLLALVGVARAELSPLLTMIYGNGYVFLYMTSRMIKKKNRGQFYSGFLSGEFLALMVIEFSNYRLMQDGLDPKIGWGVFFGMAGYYHVVRGIIHSLKGVR